MRQQSFLFVSKIISRPAAERERERERESVSKKMKRERERERGREGERRSDVSFVL